MSATALLRVCLAGAVLAAPSGETLAFHPEKGSTLAKSFVQRLEFALDAVSVQVDGMDLSQQVSQLEFGFDSTTTIDVTDAYKAVGEGRPLELLRTFDTLASDTNLDMSMGAEIPEMEIASDLEGKTVAFLWNAEKDAYDLSFHECEGEDGLLDDLDEDMDLRFLLPEGAIEPGKSWTVPLKGLKSLVMPGGNLKLMPVGGASAPEDMEVFEGIMENVGKEFVDLLEGKCEATLRGVETVDGAKHGTVELAIDASVSMDLREILRQVIDTAMTKMPPEVELDLEFDIGTADLELSYEGTGTLVWDLTAGHFRTLTLEGDATMALKLSVKVSAMGESHSVDSSMEASGSVSHDISLKE